jgi:hypothetical protein
MIKRVSLAMPHDTNTISFLPFWLSCMHEGNAHLLLRYLCMQWPQFSATAARIIRLMTSLNLSDWTLEAESVPLTIRIPLEWSPHRGKVKHLSPNFYIFLVYVKSWCPLKLLIPTSSHRIIIFLCGLMTGPSLSVNISQCMIVPTHNLTKVNTATNF